MKPLEPPVCIICGNRFHAETGGVFRGDEFTCNACREEAAEQFEDEDETT